MGTSIVRCASSSRSFAAATKCAHSFSTEAERAVPRDLLQRSAHFFKWRRRREAPHIFERGAPPSGVLLRHGLIHRRCWGKALDPSARTRAFGPIFLRIPHPFSPQRVHSRQRVHSPEFPKPPWTSSSRSPDCDAPDAFCRSSGYHNTGYGAGARPGPRNFCQTNDPPGEGGPIPMATTATQSDFHYPHSEGAGAEATFLESSCDHGRETVATARPLISGGHTFVSVFEFGAVSIFEFVAGSTHLRTQ